MDRGEARARNSGTLGRHEFSLCFAVLCIPLPLSLSLSTSAVLVPKTNGLRVGVKKRRTFELQNYRLSILYLCQPQHTL